MRIIFMGTGDIAIPAFRTLLENADYEVVALYTQPDKPVGRKQVMTPPAIKVVAGEHGVPVLQPEKIRDKEALDTLEAFEAKIIVVMAYGQMLPVRLLEMPPIACINLHASLLPRHRGAAPIQAAIRDGDEETGITVMHIAKGMDTGDMILKKTIPLDARMTGGVLHDRLAELAPEALNTALPLLIAGTAKREAQNEELATYTGKLGREDGIIQWEANADEIERRIRAYDPWPGSSTRFEDQKGKLRTLKIFPPVDVVPVATTHAPGEIMEVDKTSLVIATGGGGLKLHEVQPDGKKRMPVASFLAGNPLTNGRKLGER